MDLNAEKRESAPRWFGRLVLAVFSRSAAYQAGQREGYSAGYREGYTDGSEDTSRSLTARRAARDA